MAGSKAVDTTGAKRKSIRFGSEPASGEAPVSLSVLIRKRSFNLVPPADAATIHRALGAFQRHPTGAFMRATRLNVSDLIRHRCPTVGPVHVSKDAALFHVYNAYDHAASGIDRQIHKEQGHNDRQWLVMPSLSLRLEHSHQIDPVYCQQHTPTPAINASRSRRVG